MANTRQTRHPDAFKAKVALEAVKQTRTLARAVAGLPGPPGPEALRYNGSFAPPIRLSESCVASRRDWFAGDNRLGS
jgi:hypothetical protein